jgi:hypothetical protein
MTMLAILAAGSAAASAAAAPYRAPRTAFGAPDLQGIWTNSSITMLQRPPNMKSLIATDAQAAAMEQGFRQFVGDYLAPTADPDAPAPPVVEEAPQADILEMDLHLARIDGQMRTSWIVDPADGRLPFTEAGKKAVKAAEHEDYAGPEGRPLSERCLIGVGSPEGPPMMNTGFNANYEIVQTPDFVAIEVEMNHAVRIVRLADREHAPSAVRPWMGDSVGWYDGDTLVVETTNFNPHELIQSLGGGFAYSPKAKLVERFTRTGPGTILYEFSVEDPVYFTCTWRAQMPWRAAKGPIYEDACHEGNYSLANALSGARAEERQAKALARSRTAAVSSASGAHAP